MADIIHGEGLMSKYNKEYEEYYKYALERYLIETRDYTEWDAAVKVMQDFDEVKKEFEELYSRF